MVILKILKILVQDKMQGDEFRQAKRENAIAAFSLLTHIYQLSTINCLPHCGVSA